MCDGFSQQKFQVTDSVTRCFWNGDLILFVLRLAPQLRVRKKSDSECDVRQNFLHLSLSPML